MLPRIASTWETTEYNSVFDNCNSPQVRSKDFFDCWTVSCFGFLLHKNHIPVDRNGPQGAQKRAKTFRTLCLISALFRYKPLKFVCSGSILRLPYIRHFCWFAGRGGGGAAAAMLLIVWRSFCGPTPETPLSRTSNKNLQTATKNEEQSTTKTKKTTKNNKERRRTMKNNKRNKKQQTNWNTVEKWRKPKHTTSCQTLYQYRLKTEANGKPYLSTVGNYEPAKPTQATVLNSLAVTRMPDGDFASKMMRTQPRHFKLCPSTCARVCNGFPVMLTRSFPAAIPACSKGYQKVAVD